MHTSRYRVIFAAAVGLSAIEGKAASLSDLHARVPRPPADVATALGWIDKGEIVAPEYTRFKLALEAERTAITALNGGTPPQLVTGSSVDAAESPEVQGAANAYDTYLASHVGDQEPAKVLGKRTRWLQAAMGGRLGAVLPKLAPCPAPCKDAAIIAQNRPVLAEKQRLAQQDMKQWTTLFADWHSKRTAIVDKAQALIAATGEGTKASSAAGRSAIARYRAAMLKEIEVSLSVTELAVNRAYAIETGEYDALSSPTRSATAAK